MSALDDRAAGPSRRFQACGTCRWLDSSTQATDAEVDTTGACHGAPPHVDDRTGLAMWPFVEYVDKACPKWEFDPDAPLSEEMLAEEAKEDARSE